MAGKKTTKKNVEVLSDSANTTEDKIQNVIDVKEVKNDNNKKKYYYFNLPFTFVSFLLLKYPAIKNVPSFLFFQKSITNTIPHFATFVK